MLFYLNECQERFFGSFTYFQLLPVSKCLRSRQVDNKGLSREICVTAALKIGLFLDLIPGILFLAAVFVAFETLLLLDTEFNFNKEIQK